MKIIEKPNVLSDNKGVAAGDIRITSVTTLPFNIRERVNENEHWTRYYSIYDEDLSLGIRRNVVCFFFYTRVHQFEYFRNSLNFTIVIMLKWVVLFFVYRSCHEVDAVLPDHVFMRRRCTNVSEKKEKTFRCYFGIDKMKIKVSLGYGFDRVMVLGYLLG